MGRESKSEQGKICEWITADGGIHVDTSASAEIRCRTNTGVSIYLYNYNVRIPRVFA